MHNKDKRNGNYQKLQEFYVASLGFGKQGPLKKTGD
jgi:hypothetical protein